MNGSLTTSSDKFRFGSSAALAEALDHPGWYADFHNNHEIFAVFPQRTFRYSRGDQATRAEAKSHGRSLAIPEPQFDWTA
ncbi:hypothetical protein ABZS29_17075 [Kribbella sp. NPDC005582]|uniref:hypothetical protein n=1 Tax=Kribbella sp. NPDC005582 TaxID=3156893 RepID=UPI0033A53753